MTVLPNMHTEGQQQLPEGHLIFFEASSAGNDTIAADVEKEEDVSHIHLCALTTGKQGM